MIHRIYSNLPTFKTLEFRPGLNVLLAEKSGEQGKGRTRNRAGKSSVLETIHFLLDGNTTEKSPYSSADLKGYTFGMEFDLGGARIKVEREAKKGAKFKVNGVAMAGSDWKLRLAQGFFGLESDDEDEKAPSFRSIFPYFVRRESAQGFAEPTKHMAVQGPGTWQLALLFLLGLDWQIAREWEAVRTREKSLEALKKAAGEGAFGSIIGSAADLRTQHAIAEARLLRQKKDLGEFKVLAEYRELEQEADRLRDALAKLANQDTLDEALLRQTQAAMTTEAEPQASALDELFQEAGIVLPELVKRRYAEVRQFHASVIRNRRDYLTSEQHQATDRRAQRATELSKLNHRLSEVLSALDGHGALDQYSKLQAQMARLAAEVESLHQRHQAAETLEGSKTELELERNQLQLRLKREYAEQDKQVTSAILAYESVSRLLYEDAGRMLVEATANGPQLKFPIQGERSGGIKKMRIFCFDLMLMQQLSARQSGPGFLIHDSHLFDGVDGQQIMSGLKAAAGMAAEKGFQYIVTLNEDDAFKETIPSFDLKQWLLPVRLSDASEDGGLYGFRFD